jgi:hypothetical protein
MQEEGGSSWKLAEEEDDEGQEESSYSRLKGMWGQGETDSSKTTSQKLLHQNQECTTHHGSFHIKQTLHTNKYFMMISNYNNIFSINRFYTTLWTTTY